ncbi:MAG TPA: hypothetical protein VHE14_00920 [Solirubrobacteraceae bacterium]|nr:hypothetical protein [Solirubrobacteraceae bacterium]
MITRPRQTLVSRFVSWLLTGPIGHLVAGMIDWAVALSRYAWARARGRRPGW